MTILRLRGGVLAVVALSLLAGCGSSPATRLYSLQPAPAAAPTALANASADREGAGGPIVALGPVSLPERVDRPQIVVLTGAHTVHVSDLNRWAEPLRTAVPRQLAADLARELGASRVRLLGQDGADEASLRLTVDLLRFELVQGEAAVIEALWTLRPMQPMRPASGTAANAGANAAENAPVRSGRSLIREPLGGDDYAALVAALSRATTALGRDLAAAVRAAR